MNDLTWSGLGWRALILLRIEIRHARAVWLVWRRSRRLVEGNTSEGIRYGNVRKWQMGTGVLAATEDFVHAATMIGGSSLHYFAIQADE